MSDELTEARLDLAAEIKARRAANEDIATLRSDMNTLMASLATAEELVRALFYNTKHFSDCICITCTRVRAFLAPIPQSPKGETPHGFLCVDAFGCDRTPVCAHFCARYRPPAPPAITPKCTCPSGSLTSGEISSDCKLHGWRSPVTTPTPCGTCGGLGKTYAGRGRWVTCWRCTSPSTPKEP